VSFLRVLLITPSLPEAAALLNESLAKSEAAVEDEDRRLLAMGRRALLVGNAHGSEGVDDLIGGERTIALAAPRIANRHAVATRAQHVPVAHSFDSPCRQIVASRCYRL
jgi:hydroxymethylpyrimidine/phosphomethylpyrimidine kinase